MAAGAEGITVSDRELKRNLRRLGKAADRAQRRAKKDAGRQLRTVAKREIATKINLKVADIAKPMVVQASGSKIEYRVRYRAEPAHHYLGWRNIRIVRKRRVTESARVTRFRKRKAVHGLKVRFTRGQPAILLRKAFRTSSVGRGLVFIQRKYKQRYITIPVVGPTPHGYAEAAIVQFADVGYRAYRRRLIYWIGQYGGTK